MIMIEIMKRMFDHKEADSGPFADYLWTASLARWHKEEISAAIDWRDKGLWVTANSNFGFDLTHSWGAGTELFLFWFVDNTELCVKIFNTYLDLFLAMFQKVCDEEYHFDSIYLVRRFKPQAQPVLSTGMYWELMKPGDKGERRLQLHLRPFDTFEYQSEGHAENRRTLQEARKLLHGETCPQPNLVRAVRYQANE